MEKIAVFDRKGLLNPCYKVSEYLGMNFDRYPVIPMKLPTASFNSGGLQSFTAQILFELGFKPSLLKNDNHGTHPQTFIHIKSTFSQVECYTTI